MVYIGLDKNKVQYNCLALNVAPIGSNALVTPHLCIHQDSEQNGRVYGSHLPLDVGLQLHQVGH